MANEVFVNDREVACKAAEGKSVAAFPDVCFTPPQTSANPPGVPVPYSNTAYAKDTANGSKTVMITGKEVILKNKSYFKTSTGNEAGSAQKGVKTGKIKGKAYFTSWSMNVFIEGYNVCRHMDLTTHNHGSEPSNTGVWKYLDTKAENRACRKDKKKLDKKCKPTKEEKRGKKKVTVLDKSAGAWKKSSCKGLEVKLTEDLTDPTELQNKLDDLLDVSKQLENTIDKAKGILIEKAEAWAVKKAGKLIAKTAVKGWLGPIGWAWTAYDVVSAGIELDDMWDVIDDMKKDVENLKTFPDKLQKIKEQGLTPKSVADAQEVVAKVNPCLRARKCMLVPYNSAANPSKGNNGCCGGQTGHHLLPKSQFQNSASCPGYNAGKAPTVCAEGTSHGKGGSHQKLHEKLEDRIKKAADAQGEMTYGKAKDIATESHSETFGNCNKKCIEAQLDNYHKKACGQQSDGFKVNAASAKSGKIYQSSEDSF